LAAALHLVLAMSGGEGSNTVQQSRRAQPTTTTAGEREKC